MEWRQQRVVDRMNAGAVGDQRVHQRNVSEPRRQMKRLSLPFCFLRKTCVCSGLDQRMSVGELFSQDRQDERRIAVDYEVEINAAIDKSDQLRSVVVVDGEM